jgi:hypothetical protein
MRTLSVAPFGNNEDSACIVLASHSGSVVFLTVPSKYLLIATFS